MTSETSTPYVAAVIALRQCGYIDVNFLTRPEVCCHRYDERVDVAER
jgi:hypothetical protein